MSILQKSILLDYRDHFPKESLREVSEKTQIQLTRIFRIFNGSTMKLDEYEKMKNQLPRNHQSEIEELALKCKEQLSVERYNYLRNEMIYALKLNEMKLRNQSKQEWNRIQQMAHFA